MTILSSNAVFGENGVENRGFCEKGFQDGRDEGGGGLQVSASIDPLDSPTKLSRGAKSPPKQALRLPGNRTGRPVRQRSARTKAEGREAVFPAPAPYAAGSDVVAGLAISQPCRLERFAHAIAKIGRAPCREKVGQYM